MSPFGTTLRTWRVHRRLSQLDLAGLAEVSQRHISFLETGRSHPSREMVVHLGTVLELPLRHRNQLLTAAGFAAVYPEHSLDDGALSQVRHVLDVILRSHEPFPAYVVDRRWDLVLSNEAAGRLIATVLDPATAPVGEAPNALRLTLHPAGLRSRLRNWEEVARSLLGRLDHEIADRPGDADLLALRDEIASYPAMAALESSGAPTAGDLLVPMVLDTPAGELRLFTTIATIGAPYDVTLEELRLETLLPADPATEGILRRAARSRPKEPIVPRSWD